MSAIAIKKIATTALLSLIAVQGLQPDTESDDSVTSYCGGTHTATQYCGGLILQSFAALPPQTPEERKAYFFLAINLCLIGLFVYLSKNFQYCSRDQEVWNRETQEVWSRFVDSSGAIKKSVWNITFIVLGGISVFLQVCFCSPFEKCCKSGDALNIRVGLRFVWGVSFVAFLAEICSVLLFW